MKVQGKVIFSIQEKGNNNNRINNMIKSNAYARKKLNTFHIDSVTENEILPGLCTVVEAQ